MATPKSLHRPQEPALPSHRCALIAGLHAGLVLQIPMASMHGTNIARRCYSSITQVRTSFSEQNLSSMVGTSVGFWSLRMSDALGQSSWLGQCHLHICVHLVDAP